MSIPIVFLFLFTIGTIFINWRTAISISLDKIISVTSTAVSSGFKSVDLVVNVLTENALISVTDRVKSFNSSASVSKFFGATSDEYMFSKIYFSSYTGSTTLPKSMLFSRYEPAATAAYMIGDIILSPTATVAAIKLLSSSSLILRINGATQTLNFTSTDFSSATTLANIATVIKSKLVAASNMTGSDVTVTADNRFMITATVTQNTAIHLTSMLYPTDTTLSDLLNIRESEVATISQGTIALSPDANMNAITAITKNWAALTYVTRLTGDTFTLKYAVTIGIAKWVATQNNNFIFMPWSDNQHDLEEISISNLRARLIEAGLGTRIPDLEGGTVTYNMAMSVIYGSDVNTTTTNQVGIYAAFYAGMGASINYSGVNGKISFSGKRQDGLATNVSNDIDYDSLLSQGYQVYGSFSSRASGYSFTEVGSVGGAFLWIDNIYDSIWLSDALQNSIAVLIQNSKRIPMNPDGQAVVKSVLDGVAQSGLFNGVIETGNTFSASQVQSMVESTGIDISGILQSSGYYIYMPQITASQRANRDPLQVSFVYTNGGSIIKVAISNILFV